MRGQRLSEFVKGAASDVGFDRCGIARAGRIGREAYVRSWLASGHAGSMEYLRRNLEVRLDSAHVLAGAKSVVVVALVYRQPGSVPRTGAPELHGRVAKYAWGDDYHNIIKGKLTSMAERMRAGLGQPFEAKACVDTAPLLERELAAAAGVGWIGKNTLVIGRGLGSYFFLGALVTTLELEPDEPMTDRCGTCTACLEACPTGALTRPYQMDASRCISYLTIEHRGDIDRALQMRMGNWIFGCDICQEVCPYNRRAPASDEPGFAIRAPGPEPLLEDILQWSDVDYRRHLRGSAIKRATLEMLKRNALIAQNNAVERAGSRGSA